MDSDFIFDLSRSVQYSDQSSKYAKKLAESRKRGRSGSRSRQTAQNGVISRCFFAETAKKCTKIYNAIAQPLFCLLAFCLATFSLPGVMVPIVSMWCQIPRTYRRITREFKQ